MFGTLFYLLFFVVLEFAPTWVLRIFEASDYMLEIGIPALRILALAWLVAILALVISAGLQGLSMGMSSMILTMARQAVLSLINEKIGSYRNYIYIIDKSCRMWRACSRCG